MTNTTTPGKSPAGWYPDPRNPAQEQWWSGAVWTQDFQPAGSPARYSAPVLQPDRRAATAHHGARRTFSTGTNALVIGIAAVCTTVLPNTWIVGVVISVMASVYGIVGIVLSVRSGRGLGMSIVGLMLGAAAVLIWTLAILEGSYF